MDDPQPIRAVVCDIDGVILRDAVPLPGAKEFVLALAAGPLEYVFLTNYPSETPEELQARFARAGLAVPAAHFYTSALATGEFDRS